jgi:ribosome-binding ATPase YchF (GTP1/OBG family)
MCVRHANLDAVRLPRIKAWIDANNPGDPLIPFSVALEERLVPLSAEDQAEEEKKLGATSALGKITQAGYTSLDVSVILGLCETPSSDGTDIHTWFLANSVFHLRT